MKIRKSTGVISQAIFGVYDGLVSVLGVVIGLAAASNGKILDAAIGLAVAAAISMGFGEYLADTKSSKKLALAMGIATLVGTLLPIIPFIFMPKLYAFGVAGIITIGVGFIIGFLRDKGTVGYIQTFALLFIAIAATIVVALFTGAGG